MDEADYVFLDRACKVVKLYKGKAPQIVGLTATAEKELLHSEKTFLTGFLKFKIYDCKLTSTNDSVVPVGLSINVFLSDKNLDGMARLVFVETQDAESVRAKAVLNGLTVHSNEDDLTIIRVMAPGTLFLVTQQQLMRGFDYRCPAGIALFIGARFDSKRGLKQAYGRVGRYDDDVCYRFIDSALDGEGVDTEKV